MPNYLAVTIVVVNIICVLYLVAKGSYRSEFIKQQDLLNLMLENQKKMSREINELKMTLGHCDLSFMQESKKWNEWRQTFESSLQAQTTRKSKNEQNLRVTDRYKEIIDLQKQGLSVEQIAMKLEKGSGEVSFILQLAAQERS